MCKCYSDAATVILQKKLLTRFGKAFWGICAYFVGLWSERLVFNFILNMLSDFVHAFLG